MFNFYCLNLDFKGFKRFSGFFEKNILTILILKVQTIKVEHRVLLITDYED